MDASIWHHCTTDVNVMQLYAEQTCLRCGDEM